MRIVGSSAMSRDVLLRVSGPALEWRKRLSLRPALATSGARAQALVHAPAAFRRRGVFVADYEIDAA